MQKFVFNLPVNVDLMFTNHKKQYKPKIEKQQRKLMVKLSFINQFLEEDETIQLVTKGYSLVNTLAQLITGWLFISQKRCLFVFTDKRIFQIPVNMNYSYRNSIVQIIYSRCKSIQLKLGTLVVECPACDRKDKYIGIGRKERKKIKALLKTITFGGEKNEGTIKDHLCPRCTQELDKGIYICKNCNTEFKSKKMARILSIFLPGGGYFYTRHFFIGFINSLIEISLLFFAGLYCYRMLNNIENNVLFFTICIVSLICEKVISVIHSNHFINEFIPKTKTIYSSI